MAGEAGRGVDGVAVLLGLPVVELCGAEEFGGDGTAKGASASPTDGRCGGEVPFVGTPAPDFKGEEPMARSRISMTARCKFWIFCFRSWRVRVRNVDCSWWVETDFCCEDISRI